MTDVRSHSGNATIAGHRPNFGNQVAFTALRAALTLWSAKPKREMIFGSATVIVSAHHNSQQTIDLHEVTALEHKAGLATSKKLE